MATSFTKTYSVTVTFSYEPLSTIVDSEENNIVPLRAQIRKGIEEACRIQKGNINAQPGSVSEA